MKPIKVLHWQFSTKPVLLHPAENNPDFISYTLFHMTKANKVPSCSACGFEIQTGINDPLPVKPQCRICIQVESETNAELLRLVELYELACEDRISILQEERREFADDDCDDEIVSDFDDQIAHWRTGLLWCKRAIARAKGNRPVV